MCIVELRRRDDGFDRRSFGDDENESNTEYPEHRLQCVCNDTAIVICNCMLWNLILIFGMVVILWCMVCDMGDMMM